MKAKPKTKPAVQATKSLASLPASSQKDEREWRTRSALETITRAEEYKRDTALMRDVKRLAQQQQQTLSRVVGPDTRAKASTRKQP